MTYIQTSGGGNYFGRYQSSKPSMAHYSPKAQYISFEAGKGWLESRPAPTMGSAIQDPYDWVVHYDDIKKPATSGYPSGYLEAGTYSVKLKYHYLDSVEKIVTHFSYPTFGGASGVNTTVNIEGQVPYPPYPNGATSQYQYAPTTQVSSFEQGGRFHGTLNLSFVFTCDAEVDAIWTKLMVGKNHPAYSATLNPENGWYGLGFAGAETEIIKLA